MTWLELARQQAGVISRAQLVENGIGHDQVKRLLADGRLVAQCRAVHLVGGAPLTQQARLWIAILATRGVLGFATAAELWGMIEGQRPTLAVHIVLPQSRRVLPPPWVRVHRVPVPPRHVVERDGLPMTSKAWTLCDHLPTLRVNEATQLADRALQRHWLTAADLAARVRDWPGRAGNRRLRALLDLTSDGAAAQSERRLHAVLRRARIDGWTPNYPVWFDGTLIAVVDVAIAALRIAIEVDGMAYHVDAQRFQRDRSRQNQLLMLGWRVIRFTWADLTNRPDYVAASVRALAA